MDDDEELVNSRLGNRVPVWYAMAWFWLGCPARQKAEEISCRLSGNPHFKATGFPYIFVARPHTGTPL